MSKRKELALSAMAELFARKLSDPAAEMYIQACSGITDKQFEQAAIDLSQKSKFMPNPAEMIEHARCGGVDYQLQAELAFEELDNALANNKPSLMSPVVAAVARQLGGFQTLYAMDVNEFRTWKRKDFLATYVTIAKENPERLLAIAGPTSEIAKAVADNFKRIPSREDCERLENQNKKRLENFPREVAESNKNLKPVTGPSGQ